MDQSVQLSLHLAISSKVIIEHLPCMRQWVGRVSALTELTSLWRKADVTQIPALMIRFTPGKCCEANLQKAMGFNRKT